MSRTRLAILKIFTWFHLFGVPGLLYAATDISHLAKPVGRVTLFSFERGHLRTVTDSVNTEVVLTMSPRYFEAYLFECNATFPVQWAYIGEGAPVVTADVGRFFRDFYDVSTYTYQSILLMYSLQELQSGRYICRGASKEHDKLAIHYDVYVPGNGTQILLSSSEKKLFIPETKEHAYIPCGVSDSTAAVDLYRGNQWGTFYPVPVNGSITFNPRKGFKIKFKDFLDPWGTYLCVAASNKKRRKVHLIPESLKAKYDLINHVNGKIPVYFSYEYEYNRVVCCTGTNFIPKLQWAGCGSILDCQVKSACFEEDRCEQRLGNSGYNPTKWIDPGPLPQGCSGYRLRDDPNGDFGLFKCSTPGIAQYQPYLLNRGNIFLDFEKTPPSEMILTLQRISPEGPSYIGDELEFHCNSTRFYFAYGIRWGWEKHNGEIDFVHDSMVVRDKYSIRGHRRRTTFKIPHSDIKSIICFVPVVNSASEWRTVSLPVVIAANDINFIPHQNPTGSPPTNVVDLDALTYHTDYDSPNQNEQIPPEVNFLPRAEALHQAQPENLQVYNSAKEPFQEYQPVVPSTSAEYHRQKHDHNSNANYYSYTHDSSVEPNLLPIPSNNIEPLSQPETVEIYNTPSVGSTPSPNIIAISRSNKRSRSRSHAKSVPISKQDVHYDVAPDKDFENYDTFEPKPSSSINANSRLQHNNNHHQDAAKPHRQKVKLSSSNRNTGYSSSSSSPSRRPSSSTYRRQPSNYRDEPVYSPPKKSYRNHNNNYNDKHEIDLDELRLSLPFEPLETTSNNGGGRRKLPYSSHASSNYSTLSSSSSRDILPLRTSSRSNSRRPSPTPSTPQPSQYYHSSSSQPRHRNRGEHVDKEYSIDDTYSQHVRLSLPANSISTQLPKLQKSGRSRTRTSQPSHGRSRGYSSTSSRGGSSSDSGTRHHGNYFNNHPRNPDYYYTTDDSPVEIKVPRTKSHEPYRHSRPHHQYHQEITHSRGGGGRKVSPPTSHPDHDSKDEYYRVTSREPEQHEHSTASFTRRPQITDTYRRDRDRSHNGEEASNYGHGSSSNNDATIIVDNTDPRQLHYQRGRYHEHSESDIGDNQRQNHPSSSGRSRHRSYSRGMKFSSEDIAGGSPEDNGLALQDAYETISPSVRPVYYVQPPTSNYNAGSPEDLTLPISQQLNVPSSNELIRSNANVELKKVKVLPSSASPFTRSTTQATTPTPIIFRKRPTGAVNGKVNNSSDILHSVSISISSRITHGSSAEANGGVEGESGNYPSNHNPLIEEHDRSLIQEKLDNEAHESEDYDVYSPKYKNYKVTAKTPTTSQRKKVPIQYFHVKPSDMSSFQPAKSIIDEDEEDELG